MKEKDVQPPSQVIKPAKSYRMTYHFKKIGYVIIISSFGKKSSARQVAKKNRNDLRT
jgi:hypothetical protein